MNNDDGFTNVEQSTQSLENYEDNMSNSCEWQHCGSGLTELLRQRLANSLNEELDNFRQSMDMLTKNCNCLSEAKESPQEEKYTELLAAKNLSDQLLTTEQIELMILINFDLMILSSSQVYSTIVFKKMYYVWYCQDPDSDCQTILTSQKICLEKKHFEKGELIQYLAALCGRYNYSLPDLSILTCAYEHLIKELAKCLECFNRDQLLHIIQSIATDISLPLQMFSGYVKESETETGSMRISNSHPLDRRKPMDRQKISVKNTLCRHNQMALLKFLVPKVCEALWVDEEVVSAYEQWRTEKTLKSIPIKNSWATTVKTTLHVLSMDWYALELSDDLAKKLVLYSLFYIEQILNKDEQASILHYFILINHKALSVLGTRAVEWDHCQPLAYLYVGLIEKYPYCFEGPNFNYIMELLSGALPWFPLKERERLAEYSELLWSCILYCMETIAQGPRACEEDSTPETSIPLASPESGEGSPTVSFNDESEWLETMFYQSSTDSDGKEDERMTEEHDKLKERLLDLLSSTAPHITLCDELVEALFEMLQSSNFYGIPHDMVGKVISPLLLNASLELKKTLVDNCMLETAKDPLSMMKFFFLYAEDPATYADLAVRKCVKSLLEVKDEEILSPQLQNDVLMLRLCRFLIPRPKALTYITKLMELLKDKEKAHALPHFFERLFHFLYVFFYTSSTMDFLPPNLQMEDFTLEDFGCSEEDLEKLIRSFASLSSKYPAPTLPVFKFPFLTKKIFEETEDALILTHMYRLIPFASSELGTSFYQTVYRKYPEIIKMKDEYFVPTSYPAKLAAALLAYSVDQMKKELYYYNAYDCVLITISYQIKMTAEVIKALAVFIERADIFSIGYESEAKHQTTIDKLCNVFLIYRNPVLAECSRFLSQAHEGVAHNLSLKIPKNEKARKAITHYSNERFHIRKRDYVLMSAQSQNIVTCFMHARAEIMYFLFDIKMTFEPLGDEHIEMINLLVQSCSSALTTTSDFELITTYLNNVDIAPMAHTRFILNNIMNGVSDCSPILENDLEVKPLTLAYATTISEFFVDERFGAHKWGPDALKIVNDFFEKFADTPNTHRAFLPALATALKKIFSNKHCKMELCTVLRNIISSKMHLFPKWVEYSVCPSAFVCEILPIVNDLVERHMVSKDDLSGLVEQSVEFVLKPDLVEQLHSMFPLILQESDRFLHSRLKFLSEPQPSKTSSTAPFACYPLKEGQLMFHDALQLLCKYGNANSHMKILKLACSNLHRWCGIPEPHCEALEGQRMFKTEEFSVVFRMMVSSALFSYLTELSAYVQDRSSNSDVDYSSDSESVKKMLTKKSHLQNNIGAMENTSSGHPMSYCTYLSSEQQFIQQHWYNCYTCKMIESVGVCSVCAASCHLGHEVVYSKYGPFFCDCGARGCTSLQGAVNCSPLNACRGRILSSETPVTDAEVKDVKVFAIPENLGIDGENVRSEINTLLEHFYENWDEVENLIKSVVQAKQNQWNMDDRRKKAKEQMLAGDLNIDYKQEFMEQTFLGQKHHLNFASTKREVLPNDPRNPNRAKDISGLISLESGVQLWVVAEGTVLYIHHINVNENLLDELDTARIDTEPLPFHAKRLTACEDKISIMGRQDVLLLRFGRTGHIVDRATLPVGDDSLTNPLVKVPWCPGKTGIVALATLQHVRIYDITQDLQQFVEELVLPVGNVEDIQMFEDGGEVKVLILSSIGHIYQHKVISAVPNNNSFFMTNFFEVQGSRDVGSAVTFHYSIATQLIFVSFDDASYVGAVAKEVITREDLTVRFKKLDVEATLSCWQEVNGMITALPVRRSSFIHYFYYKEDTLLVQSASQRKFAPYSHILLSGADNETVFGLSTYYDNTSIILSRVKWISLPDFWIEAVPLRLKTLAPVLSEDPTEDLPREHLAIMMEKCDVIEKVDITSPDLSKIYEAKDLEARLKTVATWPLTVHQIAKFSINFNVSDPNMVVRAFRLELPAEKAPADVTFMGRTMKLDIPNNRFFDILLTRSETLSLDQCNLSLSFTGQGTAIMHGSAYCCITSIRVYGISRREFGYPKSSTVLKSPLSLPESAVYHFTKFFGKAAGFKLPNMKEDKMLNIARSLSSFRNSHLEVVTASNYLLRSMVGQDMKTYYLTKDRATLQDLAYWMHQGKPIPSNVLSEIVKQIKYMTYTRIGIFFKLVDEVLDGPFELLQYLHSQLGVTKEESPILLEVYVALTMIFLSSKEVYSKRITQLFLSIFTDEKLSHLAHKVRLIAQTQVYSFSMNTRNDRTIARTLSAPLRVLRWGGLRPFYQKSKIIKPDESPFLTEDLMGETISTDDLNSTDMFELEAKFIINLLNEVLIKIRDDCHMCSLPKPGALVRHDAIPATSLLILAIVLMAQLYPTKLFPTVVGLIEMVNWKSLSTQVTENTYRQFILIRLISVLLTKCGEHIENRKKNTDKDEKKDKPSLDEVVAMSLSSPSTPCPELKSDFDDKNEQEERAASKRKSTEKLLEQITNQLMNVGALNYCLEVVKYMMPYWRVSSKEPKVVSKLWSRERSSKHGSVDAVEHYYAMITDVALRLPYQMKKICKNIVFPNEWMTALCELLTFHQATQVRRQSKKLLIALCNGDKQLYRIVRDKHLMINNMDMLRRKVNFSTADTLSHQQLTEVMEIVTLLKSAANERPAMWREICKDRLMWLLELACRISGLVATQVVDLIVLAIRSSSDDTPNLADKIMDDKGTLSFVKMLMVRFLIGKDDGARWLLHGMMRSMIQLASRQHQVQIVRVLYNDLWPLANGLGSLGSQLSDLLSAYIPRFLTPSELLVVFRKEMLAIADLMKRIHREGHADAYNYTGQLGLGWKFMLMVHSPCLNCFSRKDGHELLKLSQIKTDARFSSNAMMLKLMGYHEISKVIVKLSDVKRNKIIKKVTLYYCPKMVESPIELKTNQKLWRKAGTAMGINGDGEIVITLALPVVASSLVIQFSEIAVSLQDNELHCPRCSNVVAANPGVCDNCGENAFQCVKCRAINYDERDPFLCQSCGYCKYARMEVSVNCRSLPGVQTIASDAERNNAVEMMSKLLADIETSKTQLQYGRSMCEALATQVRPLPVTDFHLDSISRIDSFIHNAPQLAPTQHAFYGIVQVLNYCKNVHEELCTQTQQLIAYREEIRRYDYYISGKQTLLHHSMHPGFYNRSSKCFGCLCANILHSFAILQGVIEDEDCAKMILRDYETIERLVYLGQSYEPLTRHCDEFVLKLAYENELGATRLCQLTEKGILRPQILAKSILKYHDQYWQVKLKALIKLAIQSKSEDATLSLLMLIEKLLRDGRSLRKKVYTRRLDLLGKRKSDVRIPSNVNSNTVIKNGIMNTYDKCDSWINSEEDWKDVKVEPSNENEDEVEDEDEEVGIGSLLLREHESWFWKCVFCPKIAIRSAAAKIMFSMCSQPGHLGVGVCMILRGMILARTVSSHMTDQYYRYAQKIVKQIQQVRIRLYKHGFHLAVMDEIYKECKFLYDEEIDESSMDLDAGLLLRNNTELFANLLSGGPIEEALLKSSRDHILTPLLESTIFLKRIVFRRTRALDSSRLALEALLKRMSINETESHLRTAVNSLKTKGLDCYTQAQVVSLIMDVLDPEQQKEEEFLITIEKDAAQEDFLQGRMTGNPYKSSDSGLGPLMRDIKNKICRDTEMIALLEDDNGMELLVNNQIISLSLPVAAVYEKLWRKTHPNQPLIIVYRMRGLLGDAVEPFVNSLQDERAEENSDSSTSSIVEAFLECKGIEIANQLVHESEVSTGGRLLLGNLKRLYDCVAKTGPGRRELVKAGSLAEFMRVVTMCVDGNCKDESILAIGLDYLDIMGCLTSDIACHQYLGQLSAADSKWLVDMTMRRKVKRKQDFPTEWQPYHLRLIPLLGNLVLGSDDSEDILVDECKKSLDWVGVDAAQTVANTTATRITYIFDLGVLAKVIDAILPSDFGKRMKSKILNSGVVSEACEHLLATHPPLYSATESPEWKTFLAKPSLSLMLQFMASMARFHEPTQLAISEKSLHILHRLEQVASDNSIGTLAENVVEALKENKEVADKIEAVRTETKLKKRQMAMLMRSKQLNRMGMKEGKSGEVKVASRRIANEPVLDEVSDPLSACCICREPVLTGPKIAAAYAFAISNSLNELTTFSTVSQMVLVHMECHQGAIRRAGGPRNTDEWSKASLHNAGAKCNCLMPIATASSVDTTEWEHSLNRLHSDLEAVCTTPTMTRGNVFSDICFLIDRFVQFSSFSARSLGGGRESNSQYLAILHLLACSLPTGTDELPIAAPRWRLYTFLMTELSLESWNEQRSTVLRAALDDASTELSRTWVALRELCISWAFVDGYFRKVIPISDSDRLEWLRTHLQETFQKTLSFINWFDGTACKQEDPKSFIEALDLEYEDFEAFFCDLPEES